MNRILKKAVCATLVGALAFTSVWGNSTASQAAAKSKKKPKKIVLNKTKVKLNVGKTFKLKVKKVVPKKANSAVTYKSSKKKIATVNKKGLIKGIREGKAKITVTSKKNKKLKIKVAVTVKGKNKVTPTPNNPPAASNPPAATGNPAPSSNPAPSNNPPAKTEPASTPQPTPQPTHSANDYSYFNDYTLGWSNGIVAYKDGKKTTLAEAGAEVYNKKSDNIFAQHFNTNKWDDEKIILTPPMQYTTEDGKPHNIDSMLTNFDFLADPTAIDNSDNDGKLYVYATTEGIDYDSDDKLKLNGYNNHSLTILSTSDMVNWTDEGRLDNLNLTNEISTSAKTKCKWATKAWAPSGLKIDGDGDGEDEYYIFYTNSGAVGYVQGDSPNGPWKDDLGKTLFSQSTPGCKDVKWCFDPAVLVDDKGDAYVYFGGGIWDSGNEPAQHPDGIAHPKTGRVCKIKFEEGTGKVLLDGEPQEMDTYYLFEDSEINQFHGKYFYSYCTNFKVPANNPFTGSGQIACYVSTDPMNIAFDPETQENTDDLKYLGTILENPSTIYGDDYNNHHHMQSFKGHDYIFYHSPILADILFRDAQKYRNLHVDEITVDKETDNITINPSYEGASQIEDFNPYKNMDGSVKYINATTAASSAGVKSTQDDAMLLKSINGSPMVLNDIDTGDWASIKGVNFGEKGLKNFGVEYFSITNEGRIELFIDDPTYSINKVASIDVAETNGKYVYKDVEITKTVTGKHDVYFVFRGNGYAVASWAFSEDAKAAAPDISDRPEAPTKPVETPAPDVPVDPVDDLVLTLPEGGVEVSVDNATWNDAIQLELTEYGLPEDYLNLYTALEATYSLEEDGISTAIKLDSDVEDPAGFDQYIPTRFTSESPADKVKDCVVKVKLDKAPKTAKKLKLNVSILGNAYTGKITLKQVKMIGKK